MRLKQFCNLSVLCSQLLAKLTDVSGQKCGRFNIVHSGKFDRSFSFVHPSLHSLLIFREINLYES